jgi:hypothetical protein
LKPARLLERGDHRQRRLGSLITVAAVRLEAVAATARDGVEERHAGVVCPEEPRCRLQTGLDPGIVAGGVEGCCAGVRHRAGLDRLLVEAGSRFSSRPARLWREAEVIAERLDLDQPAEQAQTLVEEPPVAERHAGRHARLR